MKQAQTLAIVTPQEAQQERLALLVVFGDGDNGKGFSLPQAAKHLGIDATTARLWWRSKFVQDLVREHLDVARKDTQLKALRLRDKALLTLEKAMDSPAYTPTQRAAAKDILLLGMGDAPAADAKVGLVVQVNNVLPTGLLEAQQRRHTRRVAEDVVEGEVVPVE